MQQQATTSEDDENDEDDVASCDESDEAVARGDVGAPAPAEVGAATACANRRSLLREQYLFECGCERCLADSA
jgi:hypothetical protein